MVQEFAKSPVGLAYRSLWAVGPRSSATYRRQECRVRVDSARQISNAGCATAQQWPGSRPADGCRRLRAGLSAIMPRQAMTARTAMPRLGRLGSALSQVRTNHRGSGDTPKRHKLGQVCPPNSADCPLHHCGVMWCKTYREARDGCKG